jgi:hypothetical protein
MKMKKTECRYAKVSVTETGTLQYLVIMFFHKPGSHREAQKVTKHV